MAEGKEFWNIKAKSFPGHREGDTYQAKMLDIMEKHGVTLEGSSVIDLGCGSGAYTIHMARKAKSVTALDISEAMLEGVRKSAKENGITNIEYINCDWMDFEPPHKYDIIFASLTPAVKDSESVEKIRQYAGKWVVNITFSGPMKANVLEGLSKLYEKRRKNDSKLEQVMKKWLVENNIGFDSERVQGEWITERTYQEMIDNCVDLVEANGTKPDIEIIKQFIEQFKDEETGRYISKTSYDVEMIIWKI